MNRREMQLWQKVRYTPRLENTPENRAMDAAFPLPTRPKLFVEYMICGIYKDTCVLQREVAGGIESISGVPFRDVTPVGQVNTPEPEGDPEYEDRSSLDRWDEL